MTAGRSCTPRWASPSCRWGGATKRSMRSSRQCSSAGSTSTRSRPTSSLSSTPVFAARRRTSSATDVFVRFLQALRRADLVETFVHLVAGELVAEREAVVDVGEVDDGLVIVPRKRLAAQGA